MTVTATLDTLRVDSVGSFLRPAALKDAFERRAAGTLDDAGLRAAQDAAIRDLIKAEEAHGMPIVGDGEFRRRNFNQSFATVAGMEPWYARLNRTGPIEQEGVVAAGLKRDVGNEFRTPATVSSAAATSTRVLPPSPGWSRGTRGSTAPDRSSRRAWSPPGSSATWATSFARR